MGAARSRRRPGLRAAGLMQSLDPRWDKIPVLKSVHVDKGGIPMPDHECGKFKKYSLKLTGILAGLGFNVMTEKLGLAPIPLSNGDSLDLNPGYVLKQEINNLCAEGQSQSLFPV